MQVKCSHCGNIAKAPDEYSGKSVECSKCHKSSVAVAYERKAEICGVLETIEAEESKTKTPPEPAGPILLPIVGVLMIIFGALSIPVTSGAGAIGVVGGIVLIALASIQEHVQKTAYWAKRIHDELRGQNEGQKK
jgi:hypothetical protein